MKGIAYCLLKKRLNRINDASASHSCRSRFHRHRERLCAELAAQLRTDEERKRFLDGASIAARRDGGVPTASAPPANITNSSPSGTIAAATLDRTARILMRYIGPIAAVLVKKTAPAALNESDLYARLAERLTDVRERARFIAELTRPF
jgi:hypothetical protein